jgi:hypothetical protein
LWRLREHGSWVFRLFGRKPDQPSNLRTRYWLVRPLSDIVENGADLARWNKPPPGQSGYCLFLLT